VTERQRERVERQRERKRERKKEIAISEEGVNLSFVEFKDYNFWELT
jgi:hypothetical protein